MYIEAGTGSGLLANERVEHESTNTVRLGAQSVFYRFLCLGGRCYDRALGYGYVYAPSGSCTPENLRELTLNGNRNVIATCRQRQVSYQYRVKLRSKLDPSTNMIK